MDDIRKENRMGTMPVKKLLIAMSVPMMISMLVQALYNVVDSIFIGQYSSQAFTAVSLAFPIQMLIIAVSIGTAVGMNSLLSRRLGEKHYDDANAAASNGVFLGILSWAAFLIFGLFFARMFFESFTSDAEVIRMGTEYTSICTIFSIGVFMQVMCERIMQATGVTIYNMIIQIIGAVINIILDPILIFGYLGFPEMGAAGAAVATVAGQLVAMVFGFYFVRKKVKDVSLRFKGFRPNRRIIKEIYVVGVPTIIMQAIGSVMIAGLNLILIKFSQAAVSVLGAYFRLNSFIFMPVFGLNNGLIPIVGYNYGARKKERIYGTIKFALILAVVIMLIGLLIFQFFPAQLLGFFNASPEMLAIGTHALRIISICFPFAALGIVLSGTFQAVGNGVLSMLVSLCRQLFIILPVAYFLSLSGNVDNVWYSFLIAEGVSLIISLSFFRHVHKKYLKPLDNPAITPPGL
ncbi:MAG: MATE family efflux transporter [Christensenellaceae bacterium]|jgi:putative MATE family efflux protein